MVSHIRGRYDCTIAACILCTVVLLLSGRIFDQHMNDFYGNHTGFPALHSPNLPTAFQALPSGKA